MEKEDLNELLFKAALENDLELAKLLIENGADVKAKGWCGHNALHLAVWYSSPELAKLLIEKGADVNVKDERGNTPLYYAAFNDCLEMAELLIEKGADVNDKTPLYHAIRYGGVEFVKLLKKHGGK